MSRWHGATFSRVILAIVLVVVAVGLLAFFVWRPQQKPVVVPTTIPATAPVTQPATLPPPPVVRDGAAAYIELARAQNPKIATTRPLGIPVNFGEGSHLVLTSPVFVCSRRDLWLTLPDAPPLEEVVKSAANEQIHATRDLVLYVHWDADENGHRRAHVVTRDADGKDQIVDVFAPRRDVPAAPSPYRWEHAFWFNGTIAVPTDDGFSILKIDSAITALHVALPGASKQPTQALLAPRGLIAWRPGGGASWFVDDAWKPLDKKSGWPADHIIHLVPMLDGSVLQILAGDDIATDPDSVKLAWGVLESQGIDEKRVSELAAQLSDPEPEKRESAFKALSQFGPGVWPILEKMLDDQSPEAQIRLRQLLGDRATPTLGGMTLLAPKMKVIARLYDGGVIFHAPAGISLTPPSENATPRLVVPAWISMRPGRPIELLPAALVKEFDTDKSRLVALPGEWVVVDNMQGPQRFMENHFDALVHDDERTFAEPIAVDARGRWLLRRPGDAKQTLVIDPTIPDPTPRLPVWLIVDVGGAVGWDAHDWPARKKGGGWALEDNRWRPFDEKKKETILTTLPPATRPVPASQSTTGPSTTLSATEPSEPPILTDADGNRYYDGAATLRVIRRDGSDITWTLPPTATGSGEVHLIKAAGALFLFNEPGRVLRIAERPGADPPFEIEATFTHKIPSAHHPMRIWLDPAGRIVIAYDGNKLAILFPEGRIPKTISDMMLQGAD